MSEVMKANVRQIIVVRQSFKIVGQTYKSEWRAEVINHNIIAIHPCFTQLSSFFALLSITGGGNVPRKLAGGNGAALDQALVRVVIMLKKKGLISSLFQLC